MEPELRIKPILKRNTGSVWKRNSTYFRCWVGSGSVWNFTENPPSTRIRIVDHPARSESQWQLRYPTTTCSQT